MRVMKILYTNTLEPLILWDEDNSHRIKGSSVFVYKIFITLIGLKVQVYLYIRSSSHRIKGSSVFVYKI
jgi:hypothetical protein